MDPIAISAASGMRARMESLDMLANNLANSATAGFKSDREFYSLYASAEARDGSNDVPEGADTAPVIETHWIDLAQGTLRTTGNPLDLAIDGKGFFMVQGPGGPLYTRNGNFRLAPDGTLVTNDGYPVLLSDGKTVKTPGDGTLEIEADGVVNLAGQKLGQLELVDFERSAVNKQAAAYFHLLDPSTKPAKAKVKVYQHHLEESNAAGPEGAVRLISVMRQFDMLQRAAKIGAEMDRQAVDQIAKVTS